MTSRNHLHHKLYKHGNFCVEKYEGNRIFIRPENIIPTKEGLFLNLNGDEFVPLPLVNSNPNGWFLETSSIFYGKSNNTKGPCGNCRENTDEKGVCRNPECFFYKMKVI